MNKTIPEIRMKNGVKIPKLGLGLRGLGGFPHRDPDNDDSTQIEAVTKAINRGFKWLRLAHNYADGYCEELLAKIIKPYKRESLFITSGINEHRALNRLTIVEEAKKGLEKLGLDYYDLYLIGGVSPDVPVEEVIDGLMEVMDRRLTRNIGVANYRLEELKRADEYSEGKIVYDEMHYNLAIREVELDGVKEYCLKNKIILSAFRPLQLGQLARPGINIVDMLAEKYHVSPVLISLKWLVQQEGLAVVVKSFESAHQAELMGVFDFEMDPKDHQLLTDQFPLQMMASDRFLPIRPKFRKNS